MSTTTATDSAPSDDAPELKEESTNVEKNDNNGADDEDKDKDAFKSESSTKEEEETDNTTTTNSDETSSKEEADDDDKADDDDAIHRGQALQIVSIGSQDEEYAFTFHPDVCQQILQAVPVDKPVAVVSVVGAFRTGKSFLLSWFLRYLHYKQGSSNDDGDDDNDDSVVVEPSAKDSKDWYRKLESLGNDGFDWRAGSERNTTGIWMWDKPFIINNSDGDSIAVLLVDTQGMFDHETSMDLTASIFGFSTLLSSFQIYNVDKRIQEDHLQQLALFSEYARTAMRQEGKNDNDDEDDDNNEASNNSNNKPFQRMEFLVRDWQHFEDDDTEHFDEMVQSMQTYLDDVLAERNIKDLQETREQILSCFEQISCFGLVHPGFAVTKKKYTGSIQDMEPLFLELLDRLCKRVFDQVEAKSMHGRTLSAVELGSYIEAYAKLFASGAHLPTAATLLEATAEANNQNAKSKALQYYQEQMDRVSGPKCSNYLSPEELRKENEMVRQQSLRLFSNVANFGSSKNITMAKEQVLETLDERYSFYASLNDGRNPLLGLETYLIPVVIALTAVVLRWLTDATCSPYSSVCRVGSDFLSHVYAVVISFLTIIAMTKFKQIMELWKRVQKGLEVLMASPPKAQKQKAT